MNCSISSIPSISSVDCIKIGRKSASNTLNYRRITGEAFLRRWRGCLWASRRPFRLPKSKQRSRVLFALLPRSSVRFCGLVCYDRLGWSDTGACVAGNRLYTFLLFCSIRFILDRRSDLKASHCRRQLIFWGQSLLYLETFPGQSIIHFVT
jgi:hypothetical protein